jgi:hypothetical protein
MGELLLLMCLEFLGHFGGDEVSMLHHEFLSQIPAGMHDAERPKDDSENKPYNGEHTQAREGVEDAVDDEAAPLFADQKIEWGNEDYGEVYHIG